MLRHIKGDIKDYYFDPAYRGVNLDSTFAEAQQQIKTAVTGDQIYEIIAQALLKFDDSHTYFLPPMWGSITGGTCRRLEPSAIREVDAIEARNPDVSGFLICRLIEWLHSFVFVRVFRGSF